MERTDAEIKKSEERILPFESIRTKFTMMTVSAIVLALTIVTFIAVYSVKRVGVKDADQILHLMCQNGTMKLEAYFDSVEHSVEAVSALVQESINESDEKDLNQEVEKARNLFESVASNTNGVLTYYFRLDPEVSKDIQGFWYVNLDGKGFKEYEMTDITQYDTNDTSSIVWFTVPKATGKGVWLPPYVTDNLDVMVVSYSVPVYRNNQFIGVIGIEIDYQTLVKEIDDIKFYKTGYAFVLDQDKNIVYHPQVDKSLYGEKLALDSPTRVIGENHIQYIYNGLEKQAVWLPLSTGMDFYATVPTIEINESWQNLIRNILVASIVILLVIISLVLQFSEHITKPLRDLTTAAQEVDRGNYNFSLNYNKNDEVGVLTKTFKELASHTEAHINDLNEKVYIDDLTGVQNKGGYSVYIEKLQNLIDNPEEEIEFAFGVFDCDDLKGINDNHGHDSGDIYLQTASKLIVEVFEGSPVFRIGGDEFAVILQDENYQKREELFETFREKREEQTRKAENPWEKVGVTMGFAIYDKERDTTVIDVARKADQNMYLNKEKRKNKKA